MQTVATSLSSHKRCFICRDDSRSLYRIDKRDKVHAYTNHRIIITDHARCCDAHYDDDGLIRKEEFFIIPTTDKSHSAEIIKISHNSIKPYFTILFNNIFLYYSYKCRIWVNMITAYCLLLSLQHPSL